MHSDSLMPSDMTRATGLVFQVSGILSSAAGLIAEPSHLRQARAQPSRLAEGRRLRDGSAARTHLAAAAAASLHRRRPAMPMLQQLELR